MRNLFSQISLEADEVQLAEGAGEQVIDDQEIAGQVEAVNAEMQELEQAISTSEDAAEALEQVQEFVEAKQEEGGLNEQAAEAVQVATEAMLACFGGHVKIKHVSLESFGKEGGRVTATAYTLEGLGESIKKIWEAIKKWVKDFIAKAKDWFRAHFSAAGMLKKAGAALAEKARTVIGTPETKKFEMSGSERKWLSVKADDTKVNSNIDELGKLAGAIWTSDSFTEIEEYSKKMMETLKEIDLGKPGNDIKNQISSVLDAPKMFKGLVTSGTVTGNSATKTLVKTSNDVLLGVVKQQIRVQVAPDGKTVMSASYSFATDTKTDLFGKEKQIEALESSEIATVGDAIVSIADGILNRNKVSAKYDEVTKKAMDQLDKISGQLEKLDSDDKKKLGGQNNEGYLFIKSYVKNSSKYLTAAQKADQANVTYAMTVARAWLSFGKKCVSNLSDKKA